MLIMVVAMGHCAAAKTDVINTFAYKNPITNNKRGFPSGK